MNVDEKEPKMAVCDRTAVYFLSDFHLGGDDQLTETRKIKQLLSFFDAISTDAQAVYLVGDIFDFWFEYKTVLPRRGARVLLALNKLVERGIKVVLMPGNHDLWMGSAITEEFGLELVTKPLSIEVQGLRVLALHGDGLEAVRPGYRLFKRWILTSPMCIRLFGLLHPDWADAIGRATARVFRWKDTIFDKAAQGEPGSAENPFWRAAYAHSMADLLQDHDLVVLGHIHIARLDIYSNGQAVVLGDWRRKYTYAVIRDGQISLKTWEGNNTLEGTI